MKRTFAQICRDFFLPKPDRRLGVRLLVSTGIALLFFWGLFKPCIIAGESMAPSYRNGITLVFRWRYAFAPPRRGDVVTISYFGRRELLKRVVGLPGDTVEFRHGSLLVNGETADEPYVVYPCSWNKTPVTVRPGHCYVVGDNRSQPDMSEHIFGEVEMKRITGGPLF